MRFIQLSVDRPRPDSKPSVHVLHEGQAFHRTLPSRLCRGPCSSHRISGPFHGDRTRANAIAGELSSASLGITQFHPRAVYWFQHSVADIVKGQCDHSYLHMTFEDSSELRFERLALSDSLLGVPQAWPLINDHISRAQPHLMVMVHPLDKDQSRTAAQSSGRQCPCFDSEGALAIALDQILERNRKPACESKGRLCGLSPLMNQQCKAKLHAEGARRKKQDEKLAALTGCSSGSGVVRYWGLAVQTQRRSSLEGCYLLKAHLCWDVGCSSTHYSVSRLCEGATVADQELSSWLQPDVCGSVGPTHARSW